MVAARNVPVTSVGIVGGDEAVGGRRISRQSSPCYTVADSRGGVGSGMVGAGGLYARWGRGPADVVQTAGAFPLTLISVSHTSTQLSSKVCQNCKKQR